MVGTCRTNRWKVLHRGLASLRKMGLEAIGLGSQSLVAVLRDGLQKPQLPAGTACKGSNSEF